MKHQYIFFCLLFFVALGCKEDYDIPITSSEKKLLVVEGFLNSGGTTTITLTNTFKLDDTANVRPVLGAKLTVEGKDNSTLSLNSIGNGKYASNLNLVLNKEYRLKIVTPEGKQYVSEFVAVKKTPAIDSLNWVEEENGVRIFASTHDVNNNTWYYRWEYDETWEYNSTFFSYYKFENGQIVERDLINENVYTCWKTIPSTNIIIGSSAQLQSDVIHKAPVAFIPSTSEKISIRYSTLIRQYAIDKKAYEYLKIMKTNTESLGTIFDPQPSEVKGNITCITNPDEPVIGYITASDVQEKRIFVSRNQLSKWNYSMPCEEYLVSNKIEEIRKFVPNPFLPWDVVYIEGTTTIREYKLGLPQCVDCTTRGGTTSKPSYW